MRHIISTTWSDELYGWLKKQAGVDEADSSHMKSRKINEFVRSTMNIIRSGTLVLSSRNSPFTATGRIDNWPTLDELRTQGKAGEKTTVKTMYVHVDMKDLMEEMKKVFVEKGLTEPKEEKVAPSPPPPPPPHINDTLDLLDNIKYVRAMEKLRDEEDTL